MSGHAETQIIDIGPLFDPNAAGTAGLDREIAAAMHDQGSFCAAGFPGATDLSARIERLLSFFSQPEAVKSPLAIRKHHAASANIYRGFYPLPKTSHWSYNEIFDIGPEPPLPTPGLEGAPGLREANVWPQEEDIPGWRQAMLDFCADSRAIGQAVAAAVARGLGLDPTRVLEPFDGRNNTLRLLRYAPVPADFELRSKEGELIPLNPDGRRVLAREHVDTGLLSVLWQDAKGGLQMLGRDAVWRDVPPRAETLSIHCGDLMAGLSDGVLGGTRHRVLGNGSERFSVGTFIEPDFAKEVVPPGARLGKSYAAHLVEEFPARFDPPPAADAAVDASLS